MSLDTGFVSSNGYGYGGTEHHPSSSGGRKQSSPSVRRVTELLLLNVGAQLAGVGAGFDVRLAPHARAHPRLVAPEGTPGEESTSPPLPASGWARDSGFPPYPVCVDHEFTSGSGYSYNTYHGATRHCRPSLNLEPSPSRCPLTPQRRKSSTASNDSSSDQAYASSASSGIGPSPLGTGPLSPPDYLSPGASGETPYHSSPYRDPPPYPGYQGYSAARGTGAYGYDNPTTGYYSPQRRPIVDVPPASVNPTFQDDDRSTTFRTAVPSPRRSRRDGDKRPATLEVSPARWSPRPPPASRFAAQQHQQQQQRRRRSNSSSTSGTPTNTTPPSSASGDACFASPSSSSGRVRFTVGCSPDPPRVANKAAGTSDDPIHHHHHHHHTLLDMPVEGQSRDGTVPLAARATALAERRRPSIRELEEEFLPL